MKNKGLQSIICPECLKARTITTQSKPGKLCRPCNSRKKGIDLTGKRFGKLEVLSLQGKTEARGQYKWLCKCDCGKEIITMGYCLTHGQKSCGCISKSLNGHWGTRTWITWDSMLDRCYNPKSHGYHRYGGRGITVCDRWKESFLFFLEDMGERPKGSTLDRIDNDGDYCLENCRWASNNIQNRNRSDNHYIEMLGEKRILSDWVKYSNCTVSTLGKRIKRGWSPEEILNGRKQKFRS